MISAKENPKKFIEVFDKKMSYVEIGDGERTILFLHGNPTSSYLWRNIMPHVSNTNRCIAVDLIGMGDSDKLNNKGPGSYTFVEHRKWLDEFLKLVNVGENVVLVIHDWGSALGFDWARRNSEKVNGIVYMEALVCPMRWEDWPEKATQVFKGFRSEAGENMVIEKNIFVEKVLPGSIIRNLTNEEMDVYRRPFLSPEDRRPTLDWPNQIPLDGVPEDVVAIVDEYAKFFMHSSIQKLFINAEPGAILIGNQREFCRSWSNQKEVTVPGNYFVQEDSPDEIGGAILQWLDTLN